MEGGFHYFEFPSFVGFVACVLWIFGFTVVVQVGHRPGGVWMGFGGWVCCFRVAGYFATVLCWHVVGFRISVLGIRRVCRGTYGLRREGCYFRLGTLDECFGWV